MARTQRRSASGPKQPGVTVTLSTAEAETAVRALTDYKRRIPAYLASRKPEVDLLDSVMKKLSK